MSRRNYATSDDDSLLFDIEVYLFKLLGGNNRRKLLLKAFGDCVKQNESKLIRLTNGERSELFDKLNQANYEIRNREMKQLKRDIYSIRNAWEVIIDMCAREPINISEILKLKDKIHDMSYFNQHNKDEWEKFKKIDRKTLELIRDNIKSIRTEKRFNDRQIKQLDQTYIINYNKGKDKMIDITPKRR